MALTLATSKGYKFVDNSFDNSSSNPHTEENSTTEDPNMSTLTREELDAKLTTLEVRMDGRIQRIEDTTKRIFEEMHDIRKEMQETRREVRGTKTTIIVSSVSAALAIVFGVAAFNSSLLGNMVSALGVGKDQQTVHQQVMETQQILDKINASNSATQPAIQKH